MSQLRQAVEEYLTIRRALGFKLKAADRLLAQFVAYLEQVGSEKVTAQAALAWAKLPANAAPVWWAKRLAVVRGFARYLETIYPDTEVPPADLLPVRRRRPTPYLYSEADIERLMAAARALPSPLRSATFETLVGLLAVTGMRMGEALRLDREDVDLAKGILTVRQTKFGKSREVPVHPTTVEALQAYVRRRDRLCRRPVVPSFFVSRTGTRLFFTSVYCTWRELVRRAGLEGRSPSCRRSPHTLRHGFAVRTLLEWYRDGGDVAARLPLLSTYLGHVDPGSTYWYLSAAPELLALVAERLERSLGEPS